MKNIHLTDDQYLLFNKSQEYTQLTSKTKAKLEGIMFKLISYGNHSDKKINITCKIHGDFEQEPRAHVRGIGCRKCGNGYSKGEEKIEKCECAYILVGYQPTSL